MSRLVKWLDCISQRYEWFDDLCDVLYRGVCYHVEMTVGEETPFDFEYALHYSQFMRSQGDWTVQVVRDSRLNGFPGIIEVQHRGRALLSWRASIKVTDVNLTAISRIPE